MMTSQQVRALAEHNERLRSELRGLSLSFGASAGELRDRAARALIVSSEPDSVRQQCIDQAARLCPKCERNWISGEEECDCESSGDEIVEASWWCILCNTLNSPNATLCTKCRAAPNGLKPEQSNQGQTISLTAPTYFHQCPHFFGYTPSADYECPKCATVSSDSQSWQPIETAPHEGRVLAWRKEWDCPTFIHWYQWHPRVSRPGWENIGHLDGWWELNEDNPPTHWLPIPPTPEHT